MWGGRRINDRGEKEGLKERKGRREKGDYRRERKEEREEEDERRAGKNIEMRREKTMNEEKCYFWYHLY